VNKKLDMVLVGGIARLNLVVRLVNHEQPPVRQPDKFHRGGLKTQVKNTLC
jgi:hypothetical protein